MAALEDFKRDQRIADEILLRYGGSLTEEPKAELDYIKRSLYFLAVSAWHLLDAEIKGRERDERSK